MSSRYVRLAVLVAVLCGAWPGFAMQPPDLGHARSFAVLGGSAVTNTGATKIAGNVGVSPGKTVTGFPPGNVILGDIVSKEIAAAAQKDNAAAYEDLSRRTCSAGTTTLTGTLPPGYYCVASLAVLSGTLTLDAGGNANAVWIFKVTGTLTTAADSSVLVTNGGKEGNVFWQTESATLGARSTFVGNLLALTNITLDASAGVTGRLLAQTGAVTLNENSVTICCELITLLPSTLPDATVGRAYSATITASGGKPSYTFGLLAGPPGMTLSSAGAIATLSWTPSSTGTFKATVVVSDSQGFSCIRIYTIDAGCPVIDLSPLDPPEPAVCATYTRAISASGGTGPYVYSLSLTSGTLPAGLTGPSPGGVISGTPTATGDYDFTVTATDVFGCTGSRRYTGRIAGGLTLTPEIDRLPEGTAGVDYPVPFEVTGGTGPYTFTFSEPPPGLTPVVTETGFTLTGKPTDGGCYKFTVTVTNGVCTITKTYDIVICPVPVTFIPDVLPAGSICSLYHEEISATGCTGPYTFSELVPGSLPEGLMFDNGVIFGTPEQPGKYRFTIVAKGALGCTASHEYSIEIACPPITIGTELPVATACAFYEHQFTVTGCTGCKFEPGPRPLPKDLVLSMDGLLSGTPALPGDYTFDVTVTCDGCPPTVFEVHLPVVCLVTLSPPTLPAGHLGLAYDQTITACGGTPPYTFSLVSGALPPGLTLSPDGNVSGIPSALGCFTFTVRATDSLGCFGDRTYEICIVLPGVGAPVLSEWGMLALIALLAVAALLSLRRLSV